MKRFGYVAALACLLAGANGALGSFVVIGDPVPTQSWAANIQENGVGLYDEMVAKIVSGGPLEAPTFTGFNVGGWSDIGGTGTAWAVGPAVTDMTFWLNFQGASNSSLTVDLWALYKGKEVDNAKAEWSGGGWTFTDPYGPLTGGAPALPVPEPVTMLSAFMAISGLGMYIRKRMKAPVAA